MPRRSTLSAAEREHLLALPETSEEFIRHYTLSEADRSLIYQHRGAANRLGFAVQLCYLRFPGVVLGLDQVPAPSLLAFVAAQLKLPALEWAVYGRREQTRREHLVELQAAFGFQTFALPHYRAAMSWLTEIALLTDKGMLLVQALIGHLRRHSILLPAVTVLERLSAEALTRANRQLYATLTEDLTPETRQGLEDLLTRREGSSLTRLAWLRQAPAAPTSRQVVEHLARLAAWQRLDLPADLARRVHQNRLLKMAREGAQMTPADLARFEPARRLATLVALALEGTATVLDELLGLHDRIIGKVFNAAKNKHQQQFQAAGKAINQQLRLFGQIGQALLTARTTGADPFAAIESVLPWEDFTASVGEAQHLAQPADFDFLHRVSEHYATVRRYAPAFLAALPLRAAPAVRSLLAAIDVLRRLNATGARKLPADAPTAFISKRWQKLMRTADGLDRRHYELCALAELKNALRSGDMWVVGSRQFKDFEEYLVPAQPFAALLAAGVLPLAVEANGEHYLRQRLAHLTQQLETINRLAAAGELPDASLTAAVLKITPLDAAVPETAQALIDQVARLLPHVKITDLLLEVDEWTGFSRHFTHLKTGTPAKDHALLLTTLLADGLNLGLTKMAEACPGSTPAKLAWLQAWHIRDDTYSLALAELVNAQLRQPFAAHWGDGTTSSSDGQRFRAGGRAESTGHINPKYGAEPGRLFYTHVSDQYAPFSSQVINVGVRDATYVLDGLLYHESDLRIAEHYTDTAGFTDHLFAVMPLLSYRFAPRIRDLSETKLYVPPGSPAYEALQPLLGGTLNVRHILAHWEAILRLATSIKQGTVTASLMLRKLGSYPRQNGLAVALRELGRIERSLFILDWLQSVDLRRRVQVGLNKGEARNALARAVFFHRLGEIRDRGFEQQRYRASGLNLLTAAIVLWNTVYVQRAVQALRAHGQPVDEALLSYLSPLGWEHINLTGDYSWRTKRATGKFQPLRPLSRP
ncbi:Tn3 family transposase [Hymenobacter volaticus]|uniref:Tn3 family transposase n=1 Tax=Hymenobacter volaticus TaxID=2932254 RepID=A0ABY4GGZ1_9BACT|nr:Tn3 family transposase [Hymenobacter volaticus]UOQ69922.1 Tn3 family transposase [Hymenobacter volaticus]